MLAKIFTCKAINLDPIKTLWSRLSKETAPHGIGAERSGKIREAILFVPKTKTPYLSNLTKSSRQFYRFKSHVRDLLIEKRLGVNDGRHFSDSVTNPTSNKKQRTTLRARGFTKSSYDRSFFGARCPTCAPQILSTESNSGCLGTWSKSAQSGCGRRPGGSRKISEHPRTRNL